MASTEFWKKLTDASTKSDKRKGSLWDGLRDNLDLAFYKPEALADIEISDLTGRAGQYYVLKNPEEKTYLRLTKKDYFLWSRMDGTRTIKDLVVDYFSEFGSFAYARIARLVILLKANWMLKDPPVNVYQQVQNQLQKQDIGFRLKRFGNAFMQTPFAIKGVDRVVTWLYRWGGRLFFTKPVQALFVIISLVGVVLFARTFSAGRYVLIPELNGSYFWGAVALGFLLFVVILLHELSHAMTIKHYGREVSKAGVMIYLGMPGLFVDTNDIWMEDKRARLMVTWAGPFSGLILSGLAALVITIWPDFALNSVLLRFAFLSYVIVFFNINPLLNMDGYFLLIDFVEIPNLRSKSITFLRNGLSAKLVLTDRSDSPVENILTRVRGLRSFSREEVIFTIFGLLSVVWTVYAVNLGIQVWTSRFFKTLREIILGWGDNSLVLPIFSFLLSIPFVAMITVLLVGIMRRIFVWAYRRGIFSNTRAVFVFLLGLSLLVGVVVASYHQFVSIFITLAALSVDLFFAWQNAENYLGSRFAQFFRLVGLAVLVLLIGEVLNFFELFSGYNLAASKVILSVLSLFAGGALLLANASLWKGRDVEMLSRTEKGIITAGIFTGIFMIAWGVMGSTITPEVPLLMYVGNYALPWFGLVLLVPPIFSYWRTNAGPAWIFYALALGWMVGSVLFSLHVLVGYLLLLSSLGLHYLDFKLLPVSRDIPSPVLDMNDDSRLERAFSWVLVGVFAQIQEIIGRRQSEYIRNDFNQYAESAGWLIKLVDGSVQDETTDDIGLIEGGEIYAAALTLLLNLIAAHVGEKLTTRVLQNAYDTLPWEEREVGEQYCFRHVKLAETLSVEFRAAQRDYTGLLRRMPIFATMSDEEIHLLVAHLKIHHHRPGEVIIRQGKRGDRFYIIRQGHVEVTQRDKHGETEVVNQLYRGDYFGELALLDDALRNATCRTTIPTETITLTKRDFDELVRTRFEMRGKLGDSIAYAELLRRIPIFSEMDGFQVQHIAAQLREETFEKDTLVIRQGDIGDKFYVIKKGKVLVYVSVAGDEKVIAERGPGDYVGEIALLLDEPRTATVKTLTTVSFLSLDRSDFEKLVTEHLYISRGLERVSSRRMIDLRRVAAETNLG